MAGATHKSPGIAYPEQLETVQIGVTTKEDVRHLFGAPTDLQVSSAGGLTRESWAYASTHPKINPWQYFLGFGVLALSKEIPRDSFAISFSPEGTVEGIGIREFQSFDLDLSQKNISGNQPRHMSYGMNNPLTHQPR
ncbi:MAG: hypothetical protein O2999_08425 [Nitrospirae bacterium]|nr:hypothetical protein [Nitrospirota bacterium]MDA1304310.1 hypothetical protein [Nitrospirota bacterium]